MDNATLILVFVAAALSAGVILTVHAAPSRRRLIIALSVAVPIAGPVLALLVSRVRGTVVRNERRDQGERTTDEIDVEQVRRLGELPSLLELLLSADSSDRQAALVVLAARADHRAIEILRWAIEHGSPMTVLESALTLSELDLQFEFELGAAEARLASAPSPANALAVATVIANAVRSGLTDTTVSTDLVKRARELYRDVVGTAPRPQAEDARVALAELEVFVGNTRTALDLQVPPPEEPAPATLTNDKSNLLGARLPLLIDAAQP